MTIFARWAELTHRSSRAYNFRRSLMRLIRIGVGWAIRDKADGAVQELWRKYQICCQHVMSSRHVLEVGCGPGEHSQEVLELWHAAKYTGLDLSIGIVRDARLKYPSLDFLAADACHLPMADQSVDVVTSSFMFHHVPPQNRRQALREQMRVGRLTIIRDLFGMERSFRGYFYRLYYKIFDGSEYRYTIGEWRHLIELAGGHIIDEGHSQDNMIRNRHCYFLVARRNAERAGAVKVPNEITSD